MTVFRGPARITSIINNSNDSKHLSLDFFASCFFWRCWCGDAFYTDTDTLLQNGRRYAQQPLHRAAFIRTCSCADRFVHREAFTDRCIYTEVFTQRSFYTQKLLHTDALCKDAFAQRSICAQTPLHTDALLTDAFTHTHTDAFTQRNLCTEQLLHETVFLSPLQ